VALLLTGCVDSPSLADLPRCAETTSCRAAISGPGESWLRCGDGGEIEAECGAPSMACRVEREDSCVCRFASDGTVTALCSKS